MYRLKPLIGPDLDIPARTSATDGTIMGLLLRQYTDGERERHKLRGVVTGKDTRIGGSEGRREGHRTGARLLHPGNGLRSAAPPRRAAPSSCRDSETSARTAAEILCGLGAACWR